MSLLLFFLIPFVSIVIIAWCTGTKGYGFGPNDDEMTRGKNKLSKGQ
jgi:hypothetical protein